MKPKVLVTRDDSTRSDTADGVGITEYLDGADGLPMSLVTARLDGHHPPRRNDRSTKTFYLLSGSMTAAVSGQVHLLRRGDVLVVRPGEVHELEGEANMVIVCAPPFAAEDETIAGSRP